MRIDSVARMTLVKQGPHGGTADAGDLKCNSRQSEMGLEITEKPCFPGRNTLQARMAAIPVGFVVASVDALSDLVILYEREQYAIAPLPPHDLLAHLLEERGMTQAVLARTTGLGKTTVSDLTSGKRPFTVKQMHIVANVFRLPGMVFMPRAVSG